MQNSCLCYAFPFLFSTAIHTILISNKQSIIQQEIFNWEPYALALEQTFVTPSHTNGDPIILSMSNNSEGSSTNVHSVTGMISNQLVSCCCVDSDGEVAKIIQNRNSFRFLNHLGPSPFPPLEQFIEKNLAGRNGFSGAIRAWTMHTSFYPNNQDSMENGGIVIYQMKNNRWCENIQRAHKSNNIMWNVSLESMTYWQTCHDPDCRMACFRGKVQKLPLTVENELRRILNETSINGRMDHDCNSTSSFDETKPKLIQNVEDEEDDFAKCIQNELLLNPYVFP